MANITLKWFDEQLGDVQLTGSRYFGTNNNESDFDYFATDTPEARDYLVLHGFICQAESCCSSALRAVYYNPLTNVHVQLRNDTERHATLQLVMMKLGLSQLLRDKKLARSLWRLAEASYSTGARLQ